MNLTSDFKDSLPPVRATFIQSFRTLPIVLVVLLAPPPQANANEFFGLTNVWILEIHTSPADWRAITSGARLSTDFGAIIHIDGKKYENVRIRPKGGGTTVGTSQGRPPLRLTFTKDSPSEVKELSLNNNIYDSSFLRDALSYKLFRDFGVPAPRTTFAKIYVVLDAEGRRYAGLYTISEVVDEGFTKRNFGIGSGLILKPELSNQGFGKGGSWDEVKGRFYPKTESTRFQQERVLSFIRLLNEADDPTFRGEIESYVDLENYLRFVTVNVVLANLDSYLGMGKNYYIFLNPKTNKLQWIPWDHDLSFGGFFFCGTTEQRINLSIDQPSSVNDRLLERV
jgi:spore coat protein H